MGDRKVVNKYYPPDFDPAKIPRRKMAADRQYTVRLMSPFNQRFLASFCGLSLLCSALASNRPERLGA